MTFTFIKGRHWPTFPYWLCWFVLLLRPNKISREIMFAYDSKYDLGGEDQLDWNKLFGIGYTINPMGLSARFVERYNISTGKYEIGYFIHRGIGVYPDYDKIADLVANWKYVLDLWLNDPTDYIFCIRKKGTSEIVCQVAISKQHDKKSGWLLGPYFGGDKECPNKRIYNLSK